MVEELTQTRPGPPPGAGVLLEAEVLVAAFGVEVGAAAAGEAAGVETGAAAGAGTGVEVLGVAAAGAESAAYQVSTP